MSTKADHRRKYGSNLGTPIDNRQLQIQYGHNGQQVMVMFGRHIDNLTMSEVHVDEMIKCLNGTKAEMIKHRSAAAQTAGAGNG